MKGREAGTYWPSESLTGGSGAFSNPDGLSWPEAVFLSGKADRELTDFFSNHIN